jgi:hypothetical protein
MLHWRFYYKKSVSAGNLLKMNDLPFVFIKLTHICEKGLLLNIFTGHSAFWHTRRRAKYILRREQELFLHFLSGAYLFVLYWRMGTVVYELTGEEIRGVEEKGCAIILCLLFPFVWFVVNIFHSWLLVDTYFSET